MSASVVNEGARTGFFCKVPVHGDFVARALPRPVVDAWHGWLEGAMAGAIDTSSYCTPRFFTSARESSRLICAV